jgi:uncharacterized OB-fold protein
MNTDWHKVSGKGKIFSFIVVTHPVHPAFTNVPYATVLVELSDAPGVHIVSDLVDCPPNEIQIGMPVEVVFDDVTAKITLPRFRRAPQS